MLEKTYRDADHTSHSSELPISIVIPLFNEEKIVAQNLESLAHFYDQLVGHGNWLFILVDNGSTDRTPDGEGRYQPMAFFANRLSSGAKLWSGVASRPARRNDEVGVHARRRAVGSAIHGMGMDRSAALRHTDGIQESGSDHQ